MENLNQSQSSLCGKCKGSLEEKYESLRVYSPLPFKEKLPFKFCENCQEKYFAPNLKNLINRTERWMFYEHFGSHKIKSLKAKDHYKEEKRSLSGEAPKKVFINPRDNSAFLFKWPKMKEDRFNHGFRETVTELIMNKMAKKIIPTAEATMGRFKNEPVFITKIFIDTQKKQRLVHGVEIFQKLYEDDLKDIQQDRKAQRSFYTMEHISEALQVFCKNDDIYKQVLNQFHLMILTDSWLGNQDRHAENWGLIEQMREDKYKVTGFTPLFDTARGLFWNHTLLGLYLKFKDENRKKELTKYIEKAEPLISLEDNKNPNHFDLANYIMRENPVIFNKFIDSLLKINISFEISKFRGILHGKRLNLIVDLLKKRRYKLCQIKSYKGA